MRFFFSNLLTPVCRRSKHAWLLNRKVAPFDRALQEKAAGQVVFPGATDKNPVETVDIRPALRQTARTGQRWKALESPMQEPPTIIYKIVPETLWHEARAKGVFEGAPIDLSDGFIHFSTAKQVAETAARHFTGQVDLLLVAVDAAVLGDKLVYEPSRGGDLFPHLYGSLPFTAVLWETPLSLDHDGQHQFPEIL